MPVDNEGFFTAAHQRVVPAGDEKFRDEPVTIAALLHRNVLNLGSARAVPQLHLTVKKFTDDQGF